MNPLDETRIESLLREQGWVHRLARRLAGNETDADDLTQDAYLAAWEHPPRDPARTRPWLARLLRQAAGRTRRKAEKRIRREQTTASVFRKIPTPDEVSAREEARRRVVKLVLELGETHRSVILLRYFEELSLHEVARALDVPLETARTRLRRAMEELRRRVQSAEEQRGILLLAPLCGESATTAVTTGTAQVAGLLTGALLMTKKSVGLTILLLVFLLSLVVWRWPGEESIVSAPTPANAMAVVPEQAESPAPVKRTSQRSLPAETPPQTDQAPEATTASPITGLVVDPLGSPIAGARVLSLPGWFSEPLRPDEVAPELDSARRTVTDAEGRFLVAPADDQPWTTLLVRAHTHPSRVRSGVRPGDEVVVTLKSPTVLAGRVIDARGQVVPGATVSWTNFDSRSGVLLENEVLVEDDGTYRIFPLPDAGRPVIRAEAEGFAPTLVVLRLQSRPQLEVETVLPPADEDGARWLDLVLGAGATLQGSIVDAETGEPISGYRVRFLAETGASLMYAVLQGRYLHYAIARRETTTDGEGRFVMEHLPAEGHHPQPKRGGLLRLDHPDYLSIDREIPRLSDGETMDLSLSTAPSAWVGGRVLYEDGEPIPGATVDHREGLGVAYEHSDTDRSGRYRLRAPRSSSSVTLMAQSPHANLLAGSRIFELPVSLQSDGETVAPDFLIPRAPTATVVVKDAQDRPVWGAIVQHPHRQWRGVTDRDGSVRYVWAHRADDRPPVAHRLEVSAPGFVSATTEEILPSLVDPPRCVVILEEGSGENDPDQQDPAPPAPPGVTLLGRVLDEESEEPVLSFSVAVRGPERQSAFHTTPGSFRVDGLSPGTWTLTTWADGYIPSAPIEVEIEQDLDPPPVRFLLARGSTVQGRIVLPLDFPPEHERRLTQLEIVFLEIGFSREDRISVCTRVGTDGSYQAGGLGGGIYRIAFSQTISGFDRLLAPKSPAFLSVPDEATELRLDIETVLPGILMIGASSDLEQRLPIDPVRILPDEPGSEIRIDYSVISMWREASDRGYYRLFLAPGRYHVRSGDILRTIDVDSGETTTVELP